MKATIENVLARKREWLEEIVANSTNAVELDTAAREAATQLALEILELLHSDRNSALEKLTDIYHALVELGFCYKRYSKEIGILHLMESYRLLIGWRIYQAEPRPIESVSMLYIINVEVRAKIYQEMLSSIPGPQPGSTLFPDLFELPEAGQSELGRMLLELNSVGISKWISVESVDSMRRKIEEFSQNINNFPQLQSTLYLVDTFIKKANIWPQQKFADFCNYLEFAILGRLLEVDLHNVDKKVSRIFAARYRHVKDLNLPRPDSPFSSANSTDSTNSSMSNSDYSPPKFLSRFEPEIVELTSIQRPQRYQLETRRPSWCQEPSSFFATKAPRVEQVVPWSRHQTAFSGSEVRPGQYLSPEWLRHLAQRQESGYKRYQEDPYNLKGRRASSEELFREIDKQTEQFNFAS